MDFRFSVDEVSRTTLKQNPESAMAFDMDWVTSLYAKYDLEIETVDRGDWARGPEKGKARMGLQDLIIAKHKR